MSVLCKSEVALDWLRELATDEDEDFLKEAKYITVRRVDC